jgi:hypothetical protein
MNSLDLLLGRVDGGEGVRREIFSLESTLLVLTGTVLVATKLL